MLTRRAFVAIVGAFPFVKGLGLRASSSTHTSPQPPAPKFDAFNWIDFPAPCDGVVPEAHGVVVHCLDGHRYRVFGVWGFWHNPADRPRRLYFQHMDRKVARVEQLADMARPA